MIEEAFQVLWSIEQMQNAYRITSNPSDFNLQVNWATDDNPNGSMLWWYWDQKWKQQAELKSDLYIKSI